MKREWRILGEFISKGSLDGIFIVEVPLMKKTWGELPLRVDAICVKQVKPPSGKVYYYPNYSGSEFYKPKFNRWWDYAKTIEGKPVWLFEIKRKLNRGVVGEAIAARELFSQSYPKMPVEQTNILCEEADEVLSQICDKYGIHVISGLKSYFAEDDEENEEKKGWSIKRKIEVDREHPVIKDYVRKAREYKICSNALYIQDKQMAKEDYPYGCAHRIIPK